MFLFEINKLDEFSDLLIQNRYTHIRHLLDLSVEQTLMMAYIESLLSEKTSHNRLYLKSFLIKNSIFENLIQELYSSTHTQKPFGYFFRDGLDKVLLNEIKQLSSMLLISGLQDFSYRFNVAITIIRSNSNVEKILDFQYNYPVEISIFIYNNLNFIVYKSPNKNEVEHMFKEPAFRMTAEIITDFNKISDILANYLYNKGDEIMTQSENLRLQILISEISKILER